MANTENKQIPYESTQKDIRDEIGGVSGALKSTESTSRNVADILAEELARIAGHNASQVDYDNSTSQLSADDVQEAIDELASEKVDKEVGKGLSTNDYTDAEKTKLAGIEAGAEVNPTSGVKTATESFETVDGGLLSKCQINLVPVQSGSGDPYPAGGGKNKFDGTSIIQANIQSNGTISNASVNNRIIYCKCSPSTTYTISKTVGTAFRVACYSSEPTNGSTSIGTVTTDNTASSITITTDASATYIGAWVWNSADSLTADQMLATCQIELGNQATPYAPPSNIRPISGHTEVDLYNVGKNICSTPTWSANASKQLNRIEFAEVENGVTYALSFIPLETNLKQIRFYVNGVLNDLVISANDFVANTRYDTLITANGTGTLDVRTNADAFTTASDVVIKDIQLEKGNQATPYEPYLGHLYQVQIGSTVYGGYVDLVSGVMVAEYAILSIADMSGWFKVTDDPTYPWFTTLNGLSGIDVSKRDSIICNKYKNKTPTANNHDDACFGLISNGSQFRVRDMRYNTATDFANSLSDCEFIVPLATPQTIQLTPQQIEALVGQNNLSTPLSGQSIETNGVEYKELFTFADVKEYVGGQIDDAIAGLDTLVSSVRAWAGDTLKFTIPQSNTIVYHFVAMASGGTVIDAYIIKRTDSVRIGMISTQTITATYSDGILTIVLPQVEFWNYSMTIVKSRY